MLHAVSINFFFFIIPDFLKLFQLNDIMSLQNYNYKIY